MTKSLRAICAAVVLGFAVATVPLFAQTAPLDDKSEKTGKPAQWPEPDAPVESALPLPRAYAQIVADIARAKQGQLPNDFITKSIALGKGIEDKSSYVVALRALAEATGDQRVQVLSTTSDIEAYKCWLASGYVGIGLEFDPLKLLHDGVEVFKIEDGSSAQKAGLAVGDLIVAVDGRELKGMRWVEARKLFDQGRANTKLSLLKDGKRVELEMARASKTNLGLTFKLAKTTNVFEVSRVFWGSPAEKNGVKEHDIVWKINDNSVENGSHSWLIDQSRSGHLGTKISLTLERAGKTFDLELTRTIVPTWWRSWSGIGSQNYGGPGGHGLSQFALKVLDWQGLPEELDSRMDDINKYPGLILDLRGCVGDDPKIAARVAARFINKEGAPDRAGFKLLGLKQRDNSGGERQIGFIMRGASVCEDAGEEKEIEKLSKQLKVAKLVVIVDEHTRGTAVLLADALQRAGVASVVGSQTASVSTLVETKFINAGGVELYVQLPSLHVVNGDRSELTVSPNRDAFWFKPMEVAKDELVGRHWYNDAGFICPGVLVLVFLLFLTLMFVSAWRQRGKVDEPPVPQEPEKPMPKWLVTLLVGAMMFVFGVAWLILPKPHGASDRPAGAKPGLIAELRVSLPKHQKDVVWFQQMEQEMDGPITFRVVEDPDSGNWISPGIRVYYRWVDASGKEISEGYAGAGAADKLEAMETIELAATNLGYPSSNPAERLITWHRQMPDLVPETKDK